MKKYFISTSETDSEFNWCNVKVVNVNKKQKSEYGAITKD